MAGEAPMLVPQMRLLVLLMALLWLPQMRLRVLLVPQVWLLQVRLLVPVLSHVQPFSLWVVPLHQ